MAKLTPNQEFEIFGNFPEAWAHRAYELLAAANALQHRDQHLDRRRMQELARGRRTHYPESHVAAYLMLYAFAIETLLKALWLASGNKALANGKWDRKFTTHDLEQLWSIQAVGVLPTLTASDRWLLEFLRSYVEIGRYPVRIAPQKKNSQLLIVHAAKPACVSIFKTIDSAFRRLRPQFGLGIGPPRHASRGIRRVPVK